ncbi:MAG: EAL domain-containing protein, partial [Hominimerdicola sp.]
MTAREHTCLKMWEYDMYNQRIILIDKAENSQGTERYIENVPEGLISMGYVLEESADKYRKLYSDMLAGKDKVSAAIRTLKNNKPCWENITYVTRKDAFGNPYWAIGVSEDITAQKEAEARFFKEEAIRSLLSDDFLYSLRLNLSRNSLEEIITYNDKSIRTDLKNVGYDRIFNNICNSVANADDRKRLEANYTTDKIMWYAERKKNVPDFEYRQKGADGHIFWTMLTFRIAPSPDSGDFILFIHGKNIDMLKKRELALEKKAELDEITGLYNLNTIKPLIESILKNKQDSQGISALMILDADNFKQIQLSGGFLTRNEVLKQIGNDIKRNTPASSISARLTSDLFLIFYHNMAKEDILRCEESVRNAICRKYKVMNFEVELTFSAGVVYNFSEETSYDNLYRQALLALETAKRKGKDCLCRYSNSEHSDSRFELSVYSEKGSDDSILNLSSLLEKSLYLIENGKERKSINRTLLSYAGNLYSADSIVYFKSKNGGLKKEVSWNSNDSANSYEDGNADFIQNVVEEIYPLTEARIFSSECAGWENISKFLGGNKTNIPVIISVVYENSKASECILVINPRRKTDILKPLKFISDFMRHAENTEKLHNSCKYSLNHDNKTHLLNYDSYMNYLKKSNDDVYSTFGMVGIHIVDLKKFNRIYGNEHGDEIIAFASNLLTEIFGKDLCYRTSSAGFLALCPDITIENLREKYAQLQQRVSENYGDIIVTAKVWEQNSISVEKIQHQLEEKIDIALKQKKEHSSDYTDSTLSVISKKLKMSINDGGLRTFLQPKATAGTNEICGAEALVRYCTKDNKIIPPSKFLPSIEKAGLIRYVDLFVLEDVCRIIRRWLDLGWTPFTISLNYSRATILEPGILEETNRIVESYGIRKDLLEIEVTETIGSIDSEGLKDIVSRFVNSGYKIALDDFGAEYSNIYVLYSLKLTSLKLDRRIVSDIYHDNRARLVVENVIRICKQLDIDCVAEGVETQELLDVLRDMACDVIQGYYLNKPISEEDFSRLYINCG